MSSRTDAGAKLKALRKRARLSVRELAGQLGMPSSSYAYYEDSYKRPFLPADVVARVGAELVGRGEPKITEAELRALMAPFDIAPGRPHNIEDPISYLSTEQLLDRLRDLNDQSVQEIRRWLLSRKDAPEGLRRIAQQAVEIEDAIRQRISSSWPSAAE